MIGHTVTDISRDFLFCLGDKWSDELAQKVCLPHTVRLTPANSSGCRNYQGKCIYQKQLCIPKEYEGKKVFIEFGGAMGVSVLEINGVTVATHYCGYIPFIADVGDFLRFGEENTLKITLDNSDDDEVPPGKAQSELDFTYDGGLYRKASMIVHEPLYVTDPLIADEVAGGGIFVHYENVSSESADVCVKVHIKNEYKRSAEYSLKLTLRAPDGREVASMVSDGQLESDTSCYEEKKFTVLTPYLWSIDAPNLYMLSTELFCDGECVFSSAREIGIRTFEFTLDSGVIFNGRSHRFSGVNYHSTWPYIGNAVPDGLLESDMKKLKNMGCENLRSHYPFCRAVLDACNRMGMTLVVSNPGWQFCKEGIFLERAKKNMRQIIRWQRNEPSIILWEPLLNESKMCYELQLAFHELVHEEYPYADCYTASDYGPTDVSYQDYVPGMIGYEDYGFIEKRDLTPHPIWTREYGDDPDNFNDQNTVWRMPRGAGDAPMVDAVDRMLKRYLDSESNSVQYIDVYNNPRRCGYGVWPGISHNRGYHMNPCYGGHLDLFRLPRFSYYFMQSQQDREEVGDILYIASWWSDVSPKDVTVYSNAERVELICDGISVGVQMPDDVAVKHPPFTFRDVRRKFKARPYPNRSIIRAIAYVNDRVVAEQTVMAPGVPKRLELSIDHDKQELVADGADILVLRCRVCDADGNTVPILADREPIAFEIEGEGVIVGDASIMANPTFAEAGIATVLVRSTTRAGSIRVRAHMYFDRFTDRTPKRASIEGAEIVFESK